MKDKGCSCNDKACACGDNGCEPKSVVSVETDMDPQHTFALRFGADIANAMHAIQAEAGETGIMAASMLIPLAAHAAHIILSCTNMEGDTTTLNDRLDAFSSLVREQCVRQSIPAVEGHA